MKNNFSDLLDAFCFCFVCLPFWIMANLCTFGNASMTFGFASGKVEWLPSWIELSKFLK
jgi:hypothetical protein